MASKIKKVLTFTLLTCAISLSVFCVISPSTSLNASNQLNVDLDSPIMPSGDLSWNKSWSVSQYNLGFGVDVDLSGNMYVAGHNRTTSDSQALLIKFDSNGNEIWNKTQGPAFSSNTWRDIVIDSSGNLYLAGRAYSNHSITIAKYNSTGDEQWNVSWGDTGDNAYGIALDGNGNCYVTGTTSTLAPPGETEILLLKLNNSGDIQEIVGIDTPGASITKGQGNDIVVDGSGNVLITGYTGDDTNDNLIFLTCNNTFEDIQNVTWRVGDDAYGTGIALGSNNMVHVVGYNSSSSDTIRQVILRTYTKERILSWMRNWTFGPASKDWGSKVDVNSEGDIYVSGTATVSNTGLLLLKYESTGTLNYTKTWGGINGDDFGEGICVDSSNGNIFITGHGESWSEVANDLFLLKFLTDIVEDIPNGNGNLPPEIPWDIVLIVAGCAGGAIVAIFLVKYIRKKRDEIKIIE